jgi:hypothetical protein
MYDKINKKEPISPTKISQNLFGKYIKKPSSHVRKYSPILDEN